MLVLVASAGCGFEVAGSGSGPIDAGVDTVDPTADALVHDVPARLIPGGGISDAPIGGVVNVYVVNALTKQPIAGAQVDVGAISGVTDAAGLFIARAEALQGKQTVVATMTGFRAEAWVGVRGANVTMHVRPAPMPTVPQANLAGTIPNVGPAPMGGHYKMGVVSFSSSDFRLDVENQVATPGNTNRCLTPPCAYVITTRVGTVSLLASVYDVDTQGTPVTTDDTSTFLGYGIETGIAVANGVSQIGHNPVLLTGGQLQSVTVTFPAGPAGSSAFAVVGLEVLAREVLNLQGVLTPANPTAKAPNLSVVPNSKYRLTGLLVDGLGGLSVVYRRRLATTTLDVGTWFLPPPAATADHTGASWTPPIDATISGVVIKDAGTEVLAITAFDGTVAAMLPSRVTLPTTMVTVQPTAMRATFDVKNFSFENDLALIDGLALGPSAPVN